MRKNTIKKKSAKTKKLFVCMLMLASAVTATAQSKVTYSLNELQKMVRERYPMRKQLSIVSRSGEEAIKNIEADWLPKTAFVGSATYQSEVTKVSFPSALGIKAGNPAKDRYSAGIELTQKIFDAGQNNISKTMEKLNVNIKKAGVETNLLKIETGINNLFTAILINKKSFSTLNYVKADLIARHRNIKSAVESGTALNTKKIELEAEIANVDQRIIENKNQLISLCASLSFFAQKEIDTTAIFLLPSNKIELTGDFSFRPEYKLYAAQNDLYNCRKKQIDRKNLPNIALFGDGYYGRTGLNNFDNDFRFYGIAGVKLSWNIGGLYSSIHKKKQFEIEKEKVDNQKVLFEIGIKDRLAQKRQEIIKLKELIKKDDQIVNIRKEVKDIAVVQYESGTITTTDYVIKLNAESKSLIDRDIHKIQLSMAYVQYKSLTGK